MQDKYTEQEAKLIIQTLEGKINLEEILYLISDQSLREKSEIALKDDGTYTDEEIGQLEYDLKKYMISRFDKAALVQVISMDNGYAKEEIIEIAIHNPEFFEDGLASYEIQQLIASTMSKKFITNALADDSLGLDELDKMILEQIALNIEEKEIEDAWNELNGQTASPFDIDLENESSFGEVLSGDEKQKSPFYEGIPTEPPPPFNGEIPPPPPSFEANNSYRSSNRPKSILDYTPEESFAVRTYEGVSPGHGPLSGSHSSYKTINAMLFSGLDNEFARIYEDRQYLNDNAIEEAEELLTVSTNLYSAMYKYGKKMERPAFVKRVDRSASFPEMEEKGQIISNFSTSLSSSFLTHFKKAHITLVDAEIQPGTACLDFQSFFNELGEDYSYSGEREILVAPFSPITMEDVPMDEYEQSITDDNGGPPDRKVKMVISAPEKAEPLTPEEEEDKAQQLEIFKSPDYRTRAAKLLRALRNYTSKEEAMASIPPEDFQAYLKWKNAFQIVLKYQIRELSLEIDRGIEAEKEASIEAATQELVESMEGPEIGTESSSTLLEEEQEITLDMDDETLPEEDFWAEFDSIFEAELAKNEAQTRSESDTHTNEDVWEEENKMLEEEQAKQVASKINASEPHTNEDIWEEANKMIEEEQSKQAAAKINTSDASIYEDFWAKSNQIIEAQKLKQEQEKVEITDAPKKAEEWMNEDTQELPVVTEQMLEEHSEEGTIGEPGQLVEDKSLITQMDEMAAKKPLAKINAALKKFAEKIGLKSKTKSQDSKQTEKDDEEQIQ